MPVSKHKIIITLLITFLIANVFNLGFKDVILYANAQSNVITGQNIITPQGSLSTITTAANAAANVVCNTGTQAKLTISKIVQDPNNLASGTDLSTLIFTITWTDNGQTNVFTLNGPASSQGVCITAGHTFSVSETGTPTGFTFNSQLSNTCSGTAVANQDVSCVITNTILSSTGQTNNNLIIPGTTTNPLSAASNGVQTPRLITPQGALSVPAGSIVGEANNTGRLKVITHNVNNCRPQSSCAKIASFYPTVLVHTFVNNQYAEMTNFPGSEVGRTVSFFILGPELQYDAQEQEQGTSLSFANITITHTSDCEGVIHAKENKVCTINNYIHSPVQIAENGVGQLKVITHNVNNCRPQSSCAKIASFYPTVLVHTFVNNQYAEKTRFPGSEVGRTVIFFESPEVQYDVSQEFSSSNATTTHTSDCEGVIHTNENKVCTINNIITNGMASQKPTALSSGPPIVQPSNVTSGRK